MEVVSPTQSTPRSLVERMDSLVTEHIRDKVRARGITDEIITNELLIDYRAPTEDDWLITQGTVRIDKLKKDYLYSVALAKRTHLGVKLQSTSDGGHQIHWPAGSDRPKQDRLPFSVVLRLPEHDHGTIIVGSIQYFIADDATLSQPNHPLKAETDQGPTINDKVFTALVGLNNNEAWEDEVVIKHQDGSCEVFWFDLAAQEWKRSFKPAGWC